MIIEEIKAMSSMQQKITCQQEIFQATCNYLLLFLFQTFVFNLCISSIVF